MTIEFPQVELLSPSVSSCKTDPLSIWGVCNRYTCLISPTQDTAGAPLSPPPRSIRLTSASAARAPKSTESDGQGRASCQVLACQASHMEGAGKSGSSEGLGR